MLSKVLAVVQSKAALAVLGVVLVGGGGTAAAYVASGHQIPLMGTQAQATEKPDATHDASNDHTHTVSIEGVLKSANGSTITVASATEATEATDAPKATAHPDATEKPEGTAQPDATEKPDATETAKSSDAPEATKTPTTYTITVNSNTRINGDGDRAIKLADLASYAGHRVQVQAEKQSDGSYVAWKVTVQGADSDGSHGGNGSTSTSHVPTVSVQVNGLQGTVKSVGTGSIVIQLADGSTKTVIINSQTQFKGTYNGAASLKTGVKVNIQATTQADGTLVATSIEIVA